MNSRIRRNGRSINVSQAKARLLVPALLILLTIGACGGEDDAPTTDGGSEAAARFADVGPDWSIVQAYLDGKAGTSESVQDPAANDEAPSEPPDINHAAAAARAIVDQDGAHERTVEAAEFLVNLLGHHPPVIMEDDTDENVVAGARALAAHAADFDDWPQALSQMNTFKRFRPDGTSSRPETDAFLEEMAAAGSPLLRAAARYYLAAALVQAANVAEASPESREASRTRAEELAVGLSAGLEDEVFAGSTANGSIETYAEAEAFLLRTIRHATIGGTLPDLTGVLLDGAEERLSEYRGRVLLIDFWATWCKPCVEALPKLRELAVDSPEDRFALLSISVDKELETVTDFHADEPMPWANWHDPNDDVADSLAVSSYPTYILADEHGEILARNNALDEKFLSMLEEAVQAGSTG